MTKRALRFPLAVLAVAVGLATTVALTTSAGAIATEVPLGTADTFAVLGGQTVTNTGPSVMMGDLGVNPGSAITGFPPGLVLGTIHAADAVALQAQSDLTTAYNNAAGQAADASISGNLGGLTLVPGVYNAASSIGLTGTLTLDAQGNPDAVWVFQAGSTLVTASASDVTLINGASPCNVFWQVGSSATLGTGSDFVGTIMALTSITATTGVDVSGRLLARNGAVTLDTNTVTAPTACETPPDTTPETTPETTPATTPDTTPATTPDTTPATDASTSTTAASTSTTGRTTTTAVTTTAPGGPPPSLARTGSQSAVPAVFTGLLAILLGGLALRGARRYHRNEV